MHKKFCSEDCISLAYEVTESMNTNELQLIFHESSIRSAYRRERTFSCCEDHSSNEELAHKSLPRYPSLDALVDSYRTPPLQKESVNVRVEPLAYEENLARDIAQYQKLEYAAAEMQAIKFEILMNIFERFNNHNSSFSNGDVTSFRDSAQSVSLDRSMSKKVSYPPLVHLLSKIEAKIKSGQIDTIPQDVIAKIKNLDYNMRNLSHLDWSRLETSMSQKNSHWYNLQMQHDKEIMFPSKVTTSRKLVNANSSSLDLVSSIEEPTAHNQAVAALKHAILFSNNAISVNSNSNLNTVFQSTTETPTKEHHKLQIFTSNVHQYTFTSLVSKSRRKQILAEQSNICRGCGAYIPTKYLKSMRFCEYLCWYFCTMCHGNTLMVHPGLVVKAWSFNMQLVSHFARDILNKLYNRPIVTQSDFAPGIWSRTPTLQLALKMRQQAARVYLFLLLCDDAKDSLVDFERLPAYWWNALDTWSLADLCDVFQHRYTAKLRTVLEPCFQHLGACIRCNGRGFICCICHGDDILFPFGHQTQTIVCPKCSLCLHKLCKPSGWPDSCPRCKWRAKEASPLAKHEINTASSSRLDGN